MYNLIRYYNQNRKKIWIAIAIVVFAIIIIQVLNNMVKNSTKVSTSTSSASKQTSRQDNYNYSVMTEKEVDSSTTKINNKIVDQFFEYCNSGNIEQAYNLLTDKCKELLYPTLQDFANDYYSQIFKVSKTYSMQNWYTEDNSNTYKLRILDDMLATGTYNNSEVIEEYYTIVNDNNETKLNIKGYVASKEFDNTNQTEGTTITILNKDAYIDYEIYTIKIQNNTEKAIMLDSKEKSTTSYVKGDNSTEFSAFMYELADEDLILEKGETTTVKIKYNKMYNPEVEITSITFSDIIKDYEEYKNTENKKNYESRMSVTIDI